MIIRNHIPPPRRAIAFITTLVLPFKDEMIEKYLKRSLNVNESIDVLYVTEKWANERVGGVNNVHLVNGLEIRKLSKNKYLITSHSDGGTGRNFLKLAKGLKLTKTVLNLTQDENGASIRDVKAYTDENGVGILFYKHETCLQVESYKIWMKKQERY
jgi:hypothetical protein